MTNTRGEELPTTERRPPERLYGLPGAERLHEDLTAVWESDIEWHHEELGPWTIEEWSVQEPITQIPTGRDIIELLVEHVLDDGEFTDDPWQWSSPTNDQALIALADQLREGMAKHVGWFQADTLVAKHAVTLVHGEPWLDGEPMYVRRSA